MTTFSPVADTALLARLSREAIPTGAYFRTRTPAGTLPLTPQQQHANYELLGTVSSRPHTAPDHDLTPIRCLTIRPPWSDLIALEDDQGAKRIENRVWTTQWRGTLLIHAGAEVDIPGLALPAVRETLRNAYDLARRKLVEAVAGLMEAVVHLASIHRIHYELVRELMEAVTGLASIHADEWETLTGGYELVRGSVVAVADLVGIHADDGECTRWSQEGCFHWELARVQRLTTPVAARGSQRLWKPTPKLLREIADANPHLSGRLAAARAA